MNLVDSTGECWEWIGYKRNGYGRFNLNGKQYSAHYFLLEAEQKQDLLKPGMQACHHCDNRACVRPSHIFIGTQSDNIKDCFLKGRQSFKKGLAACGKSQIRTRGENNSNAKLGTHQALLIKSVPKKRGVSRILSAHFGVSPKAINDIIAGRGWKHLPTPDQESTASALRLVEALGVSYK